MVDDDQVLIWYMVWWCRNSKGKKHLCIELENHLPILPHDLNNIINRNRRLLLTKILPALYCFRTQALDLCALGHSQCSLAMYHKHLCFTKTKARNKNCTDHLQSRISTHQTNFNVLSNSRTLVYLNNTWKDIFGAVFRCPEI